ncbi:MAG TPA: M4 family metallopeptidase [Pyrinomonadaceae bacterium]|jgi:Zn-dependent metalloprotease
MRRARTIRVKVFTFMLVAAFVAAATYVPRPATVAAAATTAPQTGGLGFRMYGRPAPNFDLNLSRAAANLRRATADQMAAVETLKANSNAAGLTVRWNDFGGSPDVLRDFASAPYAGTPEDAARAFLSANSVAFGISNLADLRLVRATPALGGHLLRFQQTYNGLDVKDGGIGLVLNANNQVTMASGPYFRDVQVNTQPTLTSEQAKQAAAADLARFNVRMPDNITSLLRPALDLLAKQTAVLEQYQPQLGIYPTADGYKLVWKVAKFSENPFGLYLVSIDAHTGELVARKDFVNFQQAPESVLPFTADIYPKYPTITPELKDQSKISVDATGTPLGQERVKLRSFDASNVATGLMGTLTGTHTVVNNALISKQPFAQAARGTWHFRIDDPTNLEARTNEADQLAEPAEHQDEINAFFFTTYLLEYVDYLHVAGDRLNNRVAQGSFPDDYPNKTIPLPATVHIPNIYMALDIAGGSVPAADANLPAKVLGLDNAFALNLTSLISSLAGTTSPVVVNPTSYGHGFLFNDLALEGTVPYHEGMHAITSPIAGLEGDPEGSALNEGQADMWAFTITDNASLGDYVVNAKGIRDRYRSLGRNPDSLAYIRSARSTLKYSDIGTLNDGGTFAFEEHYDGEIYMSTMWDVREMLNRVYPSKSTYRRPAPRDGSATKEITKGTEIFERLFLGSMYVLGVTAPDTMVKARDAMLVADQSLYPTDATDASAPGQHRALIEQIFAAHELGSQALEVSGGQATISTQVTPFTGTQAAPAVPQGVTVAPASARTNRITWQPVEGAVAYEVLKRKTGFENRRQPNGKREFADGDSSTTGFRHVAFVGGSETSYEDLGAVHEVFAPEGLNDLFDSAYSVRAIGVNQTRQLGFSDLSGAARPTRMKQDVTAQVDSALSNVTFANGVFSFDNKLTNARGAFSTDKTIYGAINFQITSVSDPSITVKNADGGANTFVYNQNLALGQTSAAKRLEFNDPLAKLFTFDARVTGQIYAGSFGGDGTLGNDGTSEPPAPVTYSVFSEEKTGTLLAGDPTGTTGEAAVTYGDPAFAGITYADVEVTTKADAITLEAALSSTTAVDLDFELRTPDGKVLSSSAGTTAAEFVSARVAPNTRYVLRVKGFANGPAEFRVVSRQLLPQGSPNANAGEYTPGANGTTATTSGALKPTAIVTRLMRFTVNPLTRSVSVKFLN